MKTDKQFETLLPLIFATRRLVRERIMARGGAADPSAWLRLETLRFIDEHDGPTMREIAEYLRITAPSATSLVGTLVHAHLLTRTYGRDKRSVRVRLTAKGKKELLRSRATAQSALREVFSKLSQKELNSLISSFRKITDRP